MTSAIMTKYIIPSASISAFISSYFGIEYFNREKKLESINEAVDCLNENKRVDEAVDYILRSDYDTASSSIPRLSTRSIGALAGHGWPLAGNVPIRRFQMDEDDLCFEKLLEKFDLGEDFRAALDWLNRVPCNEDELGCTDSWFGRRPSQTARLHRILQVLFLKTEKPGMIPRLDDAVIQFLYAMYSTYISENRDIGLLALKTLANVALLDPSYASAILQSDWLPLLSNMVVNGKTLDERLQSHKIFRNCLFSLGLIDYSLRSDVYEVHLSATPPVVDVVLIHGLRGSVSYTWRQKDSKKKMMSECWPKDWLPLDISEPIRIIGLEYPSYLIQFTGTMESLQVRANRFADQLRAAGVGKRPVVFICHSMGGLLAKKLLLDMPDLLKQTVGILFIATPHKGSPIASSLSYEILYPSEDVRLLRTTNETNKKLDIDFEAIHDSIPVIASMIETKESNIIGTKGIVVPRDSAVYSKGSLYHIEEVHHNVCKPSERSSPVYGVVLNFLRDSIMEAKKKCKQ